MIERTLFAQMAAHDLKSPLTAVAGHAELIAEIAADHLTGDAAATVNRSVTRILSGVNRIARLVDDLMLLATAQEDGLCPAPVDLGPVVAAVLHERVVPGSRPVVAVGALPAVHADPVLVHRLLDILVSNALTYTVPDRPAVVDVSGHVAPDPSLVRIAVADRGIGVPDADKPAVFAAFNAPHRRHGYTGSGLGLAIARAIVERHGGSIGVEDNPGGGALFAFTLPAA